MFDVIRKNVCLLPAKERRHVAIAKMCMFGRQTKRSKISRARRIQIFRASLDFLKYSGWCSFVVSLGETIAQFIRDFNDHPTAKKFVGDIFVFADDADKAVRVGACRVLGALQHCHSQVATIVRGLLDSADTKFFIHKDALQCLEHPEALEKEFGNDAR